MQRRGGHLRSRGEALPQLRAGGGGGVPGMAEPAYPGRPAGGPPRRLREFAYPTAGYGKIAIAHAELNGHQNATGALAQGKRAAEQLAKIGV